MPLSPRARLAILLASVLCGAAALLLATPPSPRPADGDAHAFSAVRAEAHLRALLGDERPHPIGSAANEAVRGRLIARLQGLGFAPAESHAFACSPAGSCGPVTNVSVTLPGARDLPAIAITSHYDSVPAGPGAADDGQGVAIDLEVLRILAAEGPHARPLVAVFTDGEEVGLLGAEALTEEPLFATIGAVVNAEARGTSGASRMFETSVGNAPLIAAYAAGVGSPSATSLSVEVYRRLPNDTDLSVLMRAGAAGLNFAFIGGVQRYHTPRDDLAHLDLGSVQQQGEGVLGATRALLADEGPLHGDGDAVYADLGGLGLLRWPAWLSTPLFLLALGAMIAAIVRERRVGALQIGGVILAMLSALLAPVLAAAAALGLIAAIDAVSAPLGPWPAALPSALIACASIASFAALLALGRAAARAGALAMTVGVGLLWAAAGLALAVAIPGAAIFFTPALLLAVAATVRAPGLRALALALAGALAFALWAPLIPALAEALGLAGPLIGAPLGLLWGAVSPALAGERGEAVSKGMSLATWLLVPVSLVMAIIAAAAPRFTADSPASLNLLHVDDLDAASARWAVEAGDGWIDALDAHGAWEPAAAVLPWSRRSLVSAPAPSLGAGGPELSLTAHGDDGELRRIDGRLRARPGAILAVLALPPGLEAITIEGRALDPSRLRVGADDRRLITIFGPPAAGVAIDARVRGDGAWIVADALAGLPAAGEALASLRPDHAVPYQWGDQSIAVRRVTP